MTLSVLKTLHAGLILNDNADTRACIMPEAGMLCRSLGSTQNAAMTQNPLKNYTQALVITASLSLTGCASLNSQINDGQYTYQAKDVDIKHFGINYSMSLPLRVDNQDVFALTHATDCEAGKGTLQIRAKDGSELASYPVSIQESKGADKLFKHMCKLNPKLVRIVRGCS